LLPGVAGRCLRAGCGVVSGDFPETQITGLLPRLLKDDGGSPDGLCVDPVKRAIEVVEADSAAASGLLREVRGQRCAILEVREVIDIDERDDRLAVLADGDGAVGMPGLGDKFTTRAPLPLVSEFCR
jgi:hypothetical protein